MKNDQKRCFLNSIKQKPSQPKVDCESFFIIKPIYASTVSEASITTCPL